MANSNQWGPPPPGYEPEPAETVRFPFAPLSEDRPGGQHFYATNVANTAQQWGNEGKDYTFLAESPDAMTKAKELGAPKVMRGYNDEPKPEAESQMGVMPKQAPRETDDLGKFKSFWQSHVKEHYQGKDPLALNPAEEGIKAEEEARRKYAVSLLAHDPGSVDYKKYEKLISDTRNDAIKKAEWQRKIGEEDHKMSQDFFKKAIAQQAKEGKAKQTRESVQQAQEYTRKVLNSAGAYDLSPEDSEGILNDKNYKIRRSRIKPDALVEINRVRKLAGLPAIIEKQIEIPMQETTNWGLFKTGPRSLPSEKGIQYLENQVIRYGNYNGRRVAQYADGSVDYAD